MSGFVSVCFLSLAAMASHLSTYIGKALQQFSLYGWPKYTHLVTWHIKTWGCRWEGYSNLVTSRIIYYYWVNENIIYYFIFCIIFYCLTSSQTDIGAGSRVYYNMLCYTLPHPHTDTRPRVAGPNRFQMWEVNSVMSPKPQASHTQ